jgi:hypothetical protein
MPSAGETGYKKGPIPEIGPVGNSLAHHALFIIGLVVVALWLARVILKEK